MTLLITTLVIMLRAGDTIHNGIRPNKIIRLTFKVRPNVTYLALLQKGHYVN